MKQRSEFEQELWDAIYLAIGGKCITEVAAEKATDDALEAILPLLPKGLPSTQEFDEQVASLPYEKHADNGQYDDGVIDGWYQCWEWIHEKLK